MVVSKSAQRFVQVLKLAGAGICHGIEMFYYQVILSGCRMSVGVSVMMAESSMSRRFIIEQCVANFFLRIFTNGPAIWGGCVTRRQHRHNVVPVGHKAVTVQGGYGTCFCHQGTIFNEHYELRGTRLIGSRKQVKVHKVLLRALERSRYKLLQICLWSRSKGKNRDKQLTHIVRVSQSYVLFIYFDSIFN
jgi:hypothetical protein